MEAGGQDGLSQQDDEANVTISSEPIWNNDDNLMENNYEEYIPGNLSYQDDGSYNSEGSGVNNDNQINQNQVDQEEDDGIANEFEELTGRLFYRQ